jgi:hypothetical protein
MRLDDIRLRILRWEHSVSDNPATLVLEIIIVLTVVFLAFVIYDGFFARRKRKNKQNKRR